MTCPTHSCRSAPACTRHVARLLADATPAARALAEAQLDALAAELRTARSGAARRELVGAGELLRGRFSVDPGGDPATRRPADVLATGTGHPLVVGAIAVAAARRAGLTLGLLAGPRGRLAVAHTQLAQPLVLAAEPGLPLRSLAGDEPLFRWLCAEAAAARAGALPVRAAPAAVVAAA